MAKQRQRQWLFFYLPFIFFVSVIPLTGQEGFNAIRGVVIDSVTRAPIPYLVVFVPNTTISTLTNEKGEFSMSRLPLSTTELAFSHLNYGLKRVWIAGALLRGTPLTIRIKHKEFDIKEVEIAAKRDRRAEADRRYYLSIFYKFFLGDPKNSECKLINPEALRFRRDGSRIIAGAPYPLLITNNRLGYQVTYYLDYFVFNDSDDYNPASKDMCFYSFQGVSRYEGLQSEDSVTCGRWEHNRKEDFAGSLGDFLSCLYGNQLSKQGYTVIKAGVPDSLTEVKLPVNDTVTKNREPRVKIDSVFFFDSERNQSLYLHYLPMFHYPIDEKTGLSGKPFCKSLQCLDSLLIFKNRRDTLSLDDDEISLFHIGEGDLEFYPNGDYQVFYGDVYWSSLEAKKKMIRILPLDYQPSGEK